MTRKTNKKPAPAQAAEQPAASFGAVLFIPLCKLKKSPRNARKTPHPKADIEALAASIAAKGLLQNLVVEPERRENGTETGYYLVTIGEGRRQAYLLRAKRKEISKAEPVRCVLDTGNNAFEISLAENVLRSPMHPADQFEAFARLQNEEGMSAEDIGARFGVSAAVVRQRRKLGAVSPALMQAYRDEELNLEQLSAFAITDDHAAQERVWAELPTFGRSRAAIMNALSEGQVPSDDRRAVFVGIEAYQAAGGAIIRDLFDEDSGGFFADAGLLNRLAREKLEAEAAAIRAEGWKWVEIAVEFDREAAAGMRRVFPEQRTLSEAEQAQLAELEARRDALYEAMDDDESGDSETAFDTVEAEIAALLGEDEFQPEHIAMGGAFVTLGRDGEPRIESGFIRPEDDSRAPNEGGSTAEPSHAKAEGHSPLSDKLVAELTAHRTAALRNELAQHPAIALIAVVHALAAATFYDGRKLSCLDLRPVSGLLASAAPGIDDTVAGTQIAARHDAWAARLPENPDRLWEFIVCLSMGERLDLLAHCASLTIDAVRDPKQHAEGKHTHADELARAVSLDMRRYWEPTGNSYLGRVSKALIVEAVREAVTPEAAENLATLKKEAMVKAAGQRLAGKGWLPAMLQIPTPLEETPLPAVDDAIALAAE